MLYKKNYLSTLSDELFRSPTSEYRAAPFWAWNCKLEEDELLRQIEIFHEMGFGGFHMHVRTGMDTEYLSDEFMHLIRSCTDKARSEKMLAWLYDEDRWPSGAAGGIVTKDKRFRARHLLFTVRPYDGTAGFTDDSTSRGVRSEDGAPLSLLPCFRPSNALRRSPGTVSAERFQRCPQHLVGPLGLPCFRYFGFSRFQPYVF